MTRTCKARGSALLVTLIALAVLMLIVVAAVQFTGTNREGAGSKLRSDELTACAESARRYLTAQLQVADQPLAGAVDMQIVDQSAVSERTSLQMAHYDQTDAGMANFAPVSGQMMGSTRKGARDLANSAPSQTTLGGSYYRVVMKCRDRGARESEVEFLFRFGI